MTPLDLLRNTTPDWFRVIRATKAEFSGQAEVGSDTTVRTRLYDLTIVLESDTTLVRETSPGTSLPKVCFDRHIVSDSTFCLGLGMTRSIKDTPSAQVWWISLREFLLIQEVATATGQWPRLIELDHGMAGVYQQAAIDAADRADLSEEYRDVLLGRRSWISDGTIVAAEDGRRLLNGRAPCPVGCVDRRGRPLLRTECCRKADVAALVLNEYQHTRELNRFWDALSRSAEFQCCETMSSCPLRRRATETNVETPA